jgi:hypothetical protein
MKYRLLFIEVLDVTVVNDHDHGSPMIMAVFLFHHRPNMVLRGGFPPVPVLIMAVRVVILSHIVNLYIVFDLTVIFYNEGVALVSRCLRVSFPPSFLF